MKGERKEGTGIISTRSQIISLSITKYKKLIPISQRVFSTTVILGSSANKELNLPLASIPRLSSFSSLLHLLLRNWRHDFLSSLDKDLPLDVLARFSSVEIVKGQNSRPSINNLVD
jgi:hypothetical protein